MTHPQVVDGGDGLQIWKAAANILNKYSRTAGRGSPPAWGLGGGLTTHHHKKSNLLRNPTRYKTIRYYSTKIKSEADSPGVIK
jgi:hypothetical protein